MIVLDASAVLAFLAGEQGSEIVERQLAGGVIGAANWSEVLQKIRSRGPTAMSRQRCLQATA